MKIEDHIRMREAEPKRKVRLLGNVAAMMITHERPGLLEATVRSFQAKTPGVSLTIIDDGSEAGVKKAELRRMEEWGVRVLRFPRAGFISTWQNGLEWARTTLKGVGGVVLLEDDLSFATGWLDVLVRMYEGAADLGYKPGAMSCLRVHDRPQSARTVNLRGIEAYQVMWHSFQVNLMPWEVVENKDLIDQAAAEARRGKHGIDVYLLGMISDRMGRTNFVSVESWVAHEGVGVSLVEGQGFRSLKHRGRELVGELRK